MSEEWKPAMPLDTLAPGAMRGCNIAGREVVICRTREGELHALDDICSHAYARMSEGRFRGTRLICPLHGASFDIRDGRALGAPAKQALTTHAVRVVDGMIEIALQA